MKKDKAGWFQIARYGGRQKKAGLIGRIPIQWDKKLQFETIPFCLGNCLESWMSREQFGFLLILRQKQSYYPTQKLELLRPQNNWESVKITPHGKGNDSGPSQNRLPRWHIKDKWRNYLLVKHDFFYIESCLSTGWGQSCGGYSNFEYQSKICWRANIYFFSGSHKREYTKKVHHYHSGQYDQFNHSCHSGFSDHSDHFNHPCHCDIPG